MGYLKDLAALPGGRARAPARAPCWHAHKDRMPVLQTEFKFKIKIANGNANDVHFDSQANPQSYSSARTAV